MAQKSIEQTRNSGTDLNIDWINAQQANTSAIERRASSLGARRSVKKHYQTAWLLKAITCIDLTTLSGDDTAERVKRLCDKAKQPVRANILEALGLDNIAVGAVCVYHDMVENGCGALGGLWHSSCGSLDGLSSGLSPLRLRILKLRKALRRARVKLTSSSRVAMS